MSFHHELGHNSDLAHDLENTGVHGAFPYSYGYKECETAPYFRTVMSYNCDSVDAPRLNIYSSPNNLYDGRPTGTSTADNTRTLNELKTVYWDYRIAPVVAVPTAPSGLIATSPSFNLV